MIYTAPTS